MRGRRLEELVGVVLAPTGEPGWLLQQEGYDPAREQEVESRFVVSNGFLGVRGSRAASRGPVWVSWLRSLSWAAWPRTFVAGLFDIPDVDPPIPTLVPAPDWLRYRLSLEGEPLFLHSGELLVHRRTLDLRRGILLIEWHQRDPAGRIIRLRALRLVSLADRALGLQLVRIEVHAAMKPVAVIEVPIANQHLRLLQVAKRPFAARDAAMRSNHPRPPGCDQVRRSTAPGRRGRDARAKCRRP